MTAAKRSAILAEARRDIKELLEDPVLEWICSPKARRTPAKYQRLLTIPLDLTAAGFYIALSRPDGKWRVRLAKPFTREMELDTSASATSWAHALRKLSYSAQGHIGNLESQVRLQNRQAPIYTEESLV